VHAFALALGLGLVGATLSACGDDTRLAASGTGASITPPGMDGSVEPSPDATIDAPQIVATWSARASLPAPQQEVAVVALAGKVYVIGGFLGTQPTPTVAVYDPAANTWSAAAPLPEPLHHVNAAVVADKIWVVGALRGVTFTSVGTTLVYDPAASTWTAMAAMPAGTERGASMVGAVGNVIYVAGGLRGGAAVADFSSFDTEANVWTPRPAMDGARDHGVGVVSGGRLYAIGGRGGGIATHSARVDAFDPATSTWTPRAPMPTSRAGAAASLVKGLVVVAGGEGNSASPSGVFANVEAYDPTRDVWSILPAMTTPRHGTGAATIGDVMYVPGGGDVQAFGATAVVEALSLTPPP